MNASDIPVGPLIVGAVLSFALEALCSAGGAALGRVTRDEAVEAEASGARGARRISFLVARRQAAIAGLVFLRIVFAAFAALFLTLALAGVVSTWWEAALAFAGILACVTALMAVASPTGVGLRRPIQTLGLISGPAAAVTAIASRTVREREASPEESEQVREDQLAVMVERVSQSVVLDENDRELLQSVFDLNHTLVREVMVPRTDMVTIGGDASLDKAMSLFTRSGFSRVPVVGETTDDLLGVVYLKDVLSRTHLRADAGGLTVDDLMRDPVFVPETKVVDDLMRDMQADQVHIALVVDEYGGIAGLVTIEDIVEELVGEISDEHDRAGPEVDVLADGVFRVPARLPIGELGDLFGVKLDDDDVDTVGGLFAKLIGRVPIAGSTACVGGIHLSAERFQGRRRRLATIVARRAHEEGEDDE